mmetsp:Transcript_8878/g.13308  ORF Transcript_8878/g.13308 Transcript_8878/m.13308 type:complete len:193 (+) Transcript_8878:135-713(+)
MAPRRNRSNSGNNKHNNESQNMARENCDEEWFIKRNPCLRRSVVVAILIWVIGIPLPPKLFYSLFTTNSDWLPVVYKTGLFGFDALEVCEESMGSIDSFDREYYGRLREHLDMSDEEMFDYLQQWMCVVPPDDEEGYLKAIQAFDMDYLPSRVYGEDSIDVDSAMYSDDINFVDEKWFGSVYQQVESEPLNI